MHKILRDGVRISCRTSGLPAGAKCALLIHGLNANIAFWHPALIRHLSQRRRLIMYDQRGHGYSDTPAEGYKSHELALDAMAVLDHHQVDCADIVGHSFGAVVAFQLVRLFPERVRSVVVLDARMRLFQPDLRLADCPLLEQWRQHLVAAGFDLSPDTPTDHLLPLKLVGGDFDKAAKRAEADGFFVPRESARTSAKYRKLVTSTSAREDFKDTSGLTLDLLRDLKHPSLLLYGTRSPFLPSRDGLQREIPNCECKMIVGAGHHFPFVQPEATSRAIDHFWDSLDLDDDSEPVSDAATELSGTLLAMNSWYDSVMHEAGFNEFYDQSDYANFGYWEEGTHSAGGAAEQLVERLLAHIPDKRGKILDVACGKGASTRQLLRYYARENITAIDSSRKQLLRVRENAPGVAAECMDAVQLRFAGESFDAILCVEAAFHFHTREAFLREAIRVLKPGGWLVLSDILMTREAEQERRFRHLDNYLEDPSEYQDLLCRVGFRDTQVTDATAVCFHGAFRHMVRYFHQRLLNRETDAATIRQRLDNIYRHAIDLRYYVLAAGRKSTSHS